jgi:hypothetical protein
MPPPPAQPSCGRQRSRCLVSALRSFPPTTHPLLALRVAPAPSGTATRCSASRQKTPGGEGKLAVTKAAPPTESSAKDERNHERSHCTRSPDPTLRTRRPCGRGPCGQARRLRRVEARHRSAAGPRHSEGHVRRTIRGLEAVGSAGPGARPGEGPGHHRTPGRRVPHPRR